MELWQLKQMQLLPLEIKIQKTLIRIKEWYEHWNGEVYVSFSGGKDSTVLLSLVRSIYPDVKGVFCDTGLEFPEIKAFVNTINNIDIIRPDKSFQEVITEFGFPVISKETSRKIRQIKNPNVGERYRNAMLNGDERGKAGKLAEKWKFLIDAPFNCSEQCCEYLKKKPFKLYERTNKCKAIIGDMASDSRLRQKSYLQNGCNAFTGNRPISNPMSFWLTSDVWDYIKLNKLSYSEIYDMGYLRTGCIFCMFGCHMEKYPNRFQRMKSTHPKLHDYCINKLGLKKVLDTIKVPMEG